MKQYSDRLSDATIAHIDNIDEKTRVSIDRSEMTTISVATDDGVTTLRFDFGDSAVRRSQQVRIFECDDRCIFLSNSTEPGFADDRTPSLHYS